MNFHSNTHIHNDLSTVNINSSGLQTNRNNNNPVINKIKGHYSNYLPLLGGDSTSNRNKSSTQISTQHYSKDRPQKQLRGVRSSLFQKPNLNVSNIIDKANMFNEESNAHYKSLTTTANPSRRRDLVSQDNQQGPYLPSSSATKFYQTQRCKSVNGTFNRSRAMNNQYQTQLNHNTNYHL